MVKISLYLISLLFLYRFDLIFLILDPQDELFDRRLANHLVSLYYQSEEDQAQDYVVCDKFKIHCIIFLGFKLNLK